MNRTALTNAQLLTLSTEGVISRGFIQIENERILNLGPMETYKPVPGETTMDLNGRTVLPGLIDSHCHLISENAYPISESYLARSCIAGVRAARLALTNGITSVRDVGCRHQGIYALKSAVEQGDIPGPRFQTAGRPISGTGIMKTWRSHSHDGPAEILRGVRTEWEAGATWIKLSISDGRWHPTDSWEDTPLLSQEEISAAVREAHAKHLRIVCHVDGPVGAELAVNAGVDSIEHGVSIPDSILAEMAAQGVAFVPTVWIYRTQDLAVFRADLNMLNDLHADTIARAKSAGVLIAAGIDYSYAACPPLEGMINELSTLMSCGLTAMEALTAATVNGARIMGWDTHLGSLEPGKFADLIVVDGDPLEDIDHLRKLQWVMQHGCVVVDANTPSATQSGTSLPNLWPTWKS